MFRDKLQRLKETLMFRYTSITVSYLSACSSLSYLGTQISVVIVKSNLSLLPSLEKRFIAHTITYINSQCFSLSEREEKGPSTRKVHFSETQTVPQRCPTPDNGNHAAGTNCLDLPTQKCVASPNATATARAGDNDKREISAKNRQKIK